MAGPPTLPRDISANGAEIWDWAIALSHWERRQEKIRQLRADIAFVRCGSCQAWMTRGCPKERNVNGYSRGPSMNEFPCGQYTEKPHYAELRDQRRAELARLLAIAARAIEAGKEAG